VPPNPVSAVRPGTFVRKSSPSGSLVAKTVPIVSAETDVLSGVKYITGGAGGFCLFFLYDNKQRCEKANNLFAILGHYTANTARTPLSGWRLLATWLGL
jgi:hypothetical protein